MGGQDIDAGARRPLTPADFAHVEGCFAEAVSLDGESRARAIDASCSGRPHIRAEVEALLAAHERVAAASPATKVDERVDSRVGAQIGAYRLAEKIGEGGMGEVYRAERADGSFAHQVAIKITRSTIVHGDLFSRFRIERQILASLQHPNIVTLLDGGATSDGQAYLVMERVEGTPITHYCHQRGLSLDERLRLFQTVCGAVQYAHQHGIVHRDLKPGNILITADGVPKVLDFGVAKLLRAPGDGVNITAGVLPGPLTPNYASPEQLRGLPVTTASDVYALGVVLFELVCGTRPYETQGEPLDRVLEIVLHTEPRRPSATRESASPIVLPYSPRRLRGDIDAIVGKAMLKNPEQRYESGGALAADLQRVLHGDPVLARTRSSAYVFRRLAARHKTLVAVTTLALAAMLTASGIALWQREIAQRQQANAEQRFREVRQLANQVLFNYQPSLALIQGASDLRARMAADSLRYLDALAAERSGDAEVQLEVARGYMAIAEVQGSTRNPNIGDRESALASLGKAQQLLEHLIESRPDWDQALNESAYIACSYARIDTERAASHAARCLAEMAPRVAADPSNERLLLRLGHAHLFLAEAGAVDHAARAATIFDKLLDSPRLDRRVRLNLALAHRVEGVWRLEHGDARAALEQANESAATLAPIIAGGGLTTVRMDQALTLQLMGRSQVALGERAEAEVNLNRALALMRDAHNENPHDAWIQDRLLQSFRHLAQALEQTDRLAAAVVYRDAVALMPTLTAIVELPYVDWLRGSLYAGHAIFGPSPPSCQILRLAERHLEAAEKKAPLDLETLKRLAWMRSHAGRCRQM